MTLLYNVVIAAARELRRSSFPVAFVPVTSESDQRPPLLRDAAASVLARPPRRGATRVVAVDGGSGAGKSTVAGLFAQALGAQVVHTDDVAWFHSFFDWWPLLVDGVLDPLAEGRDVRYRPPAWDERGREGVIEVALSPALVVEGVGAGRCELAPYLDFLVWVDTDRHIAMERGLAREGETLDFWREWEQQEERHLEADRPWSRADLIVSNDATAAKPSQDVLRVVHRATWSRLDRPG